MLLNLGMQTSGPYAGPQRRAPRRRHSPSMLPAGTPNDEKSSLLGTACVWGDTHIHNDAFHVKHCEFELRTGLDDGKSDPSTGPARSFGVKLRKAETEPAEMK